MIPIPQPAHLRHVALNQMKLTSTDPVSPRALSSSHGVTQNGRKGDGMTGVRLNGSKTFLYSLAKYTNKKTHPFNMSHFATMQQVALFIACYFELHSDVSLKYQNVP